MRGSNCLMPRAKSARGKVRGALPRIPARGCHPLKPWPGGHPLRPPPPFPSPPRSRTVLAIKGPRQKIFSNPEKIFCRRAQPARP
jgi:hypothetical protein